MTPRRLHPPTGLLDRIARDLATAPGGRSAADLVRRHLGLGVVDDALAEGLIGPALRGDGRFAAGAAGWTLATATSAFDERDPPLAAPVWLVVAPRALPTPLLRLHRHRGPREREADSDDGGARFCVACGGGAEVDRARAGGALELPTAVVDLAETVRRLRGYRGPAEPVRIAVALGVRLTLDLDEAQAALDAMAAIWDRLVDELGAEGVLRLSDLDALLQARLEAADFAGKEFDPETLAQLPQQPGVYLFFDRRGRTLYVGQSQTVGARVASYFSGPPRDMKDRVIRSESRRLVVKTVETPLDAWLLEAEWIARRAPRLNTRRDVLGRPGEDGLLALVGMGDRPRRVLYCVRGGVLARRIAFAPGPSRSARALDDALGLLFDHPPPTGGDPERRDAALLASWHLVHPEALFLRPGIDGGPEQFRRRLAGDWTG